MLDKLEVIADDLNKLAFALTNSEIISKEFQRLLQRIPQL